MNRVNTLHMNFFLKYKRRTLSYVFAAASFFSCAGAAHADFIDDIEDRIDDLTEEHSDKIDPEAPGLPIQINKHGQSHLFHYNFAVYDYKPELYAGANIYNNQGDFQSYTHYGFFGDFAGIRYKEANDMLRSEIGATYNGRFYFNVIASHRLGTKAPISSRLQLKNGDFGYSLRTSYMDPFLRGDLQTIHQIDIDEEDAVAYALSYNFKRRLSERYDVIAGSYMRIAAQNDHFSSYAYIGFGRDIRLRDYRGRLQLSYDTEGEVTFKLTKEIDFRFL